MKKIVFILIISINLIAHENAPSVELFLGTENANGAITFTLSKQAQVWGGDLITPYCSVYYYLTNTFDYPTHEVTSSNSQVNTWTGLDFTTSRDNNGYYDIYAFGIYKLTNTESESYFYLDYRDQRFTCANYGTVNHPTDIWIKYNANNNTFYYSNNGSNSPFYSINNGQLHQIWVLKDAGNPQTSLFPNFWQNALALISDGASHPKLAWSAHPESAYNSGFNIYRAVRTQGSQQPPDNQYGLVASVDGSTYTWVDNEVGSGSQNTVFYFVKAKNSAGNENATRTNVVFADGRYISQEKIWISELLEKEYSFKLKGNYPNPFNPTTTISWQSPIDGYTTLKVYDVLGREVTVLVNETMTAGEHSIQFSGSELRSGMYFYKLQVGTYTAQNKMILAK